MTHAVKAQQVDPQVDVIVVVSARFVVERSIPELRPRLVAMRVSAISKFGTLKSGLHSLRPSPALSLSPLASPRAPCASLAPSLIRYPFPTIRTNKQRLKDRGRTVTQLSGQTGAVFGTTCTGFISNYIIQSDKASSVRAFILVRCAAWRGMACVRAVMPFASVKPRRGSNKLLAFYLAHPTASAAGESKALPRVTSPKGGREGERGGFTET